MAPSSMADMTAERTVDNPLVTDGEALAGMSGTLNLIGHGDRIVFERDPAALIVAQQCVLAETECARAFTGYEFG